jgi:hypothetical protein
VLTLPIFIFQYQPEVSTKLVGVIDLSDENIGQNLQDELNRYYRLKNRSPEYMILKVSVSNSKPYSRMLKEYREIIARKDSINSLYNQIKDQRTEYYKNTKIPNREYVLRSSYEKLQITREEKELVQIESNRFKTALDSLYRNEAKNMADSLLITEVLNSYLVLIKFYKQLLLRNAF